MKKQVLLFGLAILALAGCTRDITQPQSELGSAAGLAGDTALEADKISHGQGSRGGAVIANRGSGTISVIDSRNFEISGTHALPMGSGEPMPEPMYVVHVNNSKRVFVGDRANNRVVAFDDRTFAVEGIVPAGAGVFHMWAGPNGKQLWVNNDIDNSTTVIDPKRLEVIATVPTPGDLVAMGGKPHDVIVGPRGDYAYVTVLGVMGPNDYVVQFDTDTFAETARAAVGKDPHLSLHKRLDWLYVPCQGSDQVFVLDRITLAQETVIPVPGAHGAAMHPKGNWFFTTNISGGGSGALNVIDTRDNELMGSPVDTPYAVPHNLAFDSKGEILFVTHSGGSSDKVTVYRVGKRDPTPEFITEVNVGLNPFGLAFVK